MAQACSRPLPFYRLKDEGPVPFQELEKGLVEETKRLWFEKGDKGGEPNQVETAVLPDERVEVLTVELVNEDLGGLRVVEGGGQCITMNEDVLHC